MKELFKTAIGAEGAIEADLNDDKTATVKASFTHASLKVELSVTGAPREALDYIAEKIPGTLDDTIIHLAEDALGL